MDLVVMGSRAPNIPAALKALANALVRKGLAKSLQVGTWGLLAHRLTA